jgi:hypothetical protein
VAQHYGDLLSGFILDNVDLNLAKDFSIPILFANTLMKTRVDRRNIAQDVLHLIRDL